MTAGAAYDAVVVGSGPNGLAAAVRLARAGKRVVVVEGSDRVGGGMRSAELTVPGLVHDECSAVHPFGVASPYLSTLPLAEHGLTWCRPEVDVAHPLDDGTAALQYRDLDRTCAGLGPDGARWRRWFGPVAHRFGRVTADVMGPVVSVPRHPVALGVFGTRALPPATVVARLLRSEAARGLWGGSAAHLYQPLHTPLSSSVGTMLIAAGHTHGWPVARGGSQAIAAALVSLLEASGGEVVTGTVVRSRADLPPHRALLLSTGPAAAGAILGSPTTSGVPGRPPRAFRHSRAPGRGYRCGPAAFKVDYAVRGGVPWAAAGVDRAGTVHVGGTFAEIAAAEAAVARGEMPERPFVLVAQQSVADPTRAVDGVHPVYAYAHVPHGWDGDGEAAVTAQLERFAPGFTERIVARAVRSPAELAASNPNLVGGDIVGGANTVRQLVARPRFGPDPYALDRPGVWLCSASTPPGAGVHGMAGYHAAGRALAWLDAQRNAGAR